jgi:hypothetical protein
MFVGQADRLAVFDGGSLFFVSRKGATLAKVRHPLAPTERFGIAWCVNLSHLRHFTGNAFIEVSFTAREGCESCDNRTSTERASGDRRGADQ